jgi:hypothetical protein
MGSTRRCHWRSTPVADRAKIDPNPRWPSCFSMGNHFRDGVTEVLNRCPLTEARGLQQTITALAEGAHQTTLTLNLGSAVSVCHCPRTMYLNFLAVLFILLIKMTLTKNKILRHQSSRSYSFVDRPQPHAFHRECEYESYTIHELERMDQRDKYVILSRSRDYS